MLPAHQVAPPWTVAAHRVTMSQHIRKVGSVHEEGAMSERHPHGEVRIDVLDCRILKIVVDRKGF